MKEKDFPILLAVNPYWMPPEAKEHFDFLQQQLAKAYTPPPYIARNPALLYRFRETTWHATASLRQQMHELYTRYCHLAFTIEGAEESE